VPQSHADDETRHRAERARRVALFRYELIQDLIDPALSSRQRGRLVRELAEHTHQGPFGEQVRVSRPHHRPVGPLVARRRVRSAGAHPGTGECAHPGRGAGPGRGAQAGAPRAHRRAGHQDPAGPVRLGAVGAHPAAPLRAPGARPQGPGRPAGVRPVSGRPAQRAVDRGCAARPGHLWPQDLPVLLHRRPLAGGDGRPVRLSRGHRAAGGGAAARAGRPRRPRADLCGQRVAVRGLLAAARLRGAWHQAGALHPAPTPRQGQDRAVLPHRPQPVPGRTGRPGRRTGR